MRETTKKTLLIVVDVQNDFIEGSLGTKEAQEAMLFIPGYIDRAKLQGWDVWYTQDTHHLKWYHEGQEGQKLPIEHCISGSWGWKIADGVDVPDALHLEKDGFGYDAWDGLPIDEKYDNIVMLGFCTDICVIVNALAIKSIYRDIPITIVSKGCAGTTPEMHQKALDVMRSCQIDIV